MPQKIIKQSQKKRYRSWIILGRHKSTGKYVGIVEHSFSMGISNDRVRVEKEWEVLYFMKDESERREKTTKSVKYWQKNIATYSKRYPQYEFKIYRVGTKNCPVKIDWTDYHNGKKEKFERRNLIFTTRQLEDDANTGS